MLCISSLLSLTNFAQSTMSDRTESLPYDTIPSYPDAYTAGTVAARLVDGLGFRYRWATEELRQEDLDFQIDSTSRTSIETLDHIYGLTKVILNAVTTTPNVRPAAKDSIDWVTMRHNTLQNIWTASRILRKSSDEQLKDYKVIFQRGDKSSTYPFWNNINGPIADALWHCGQLVMLRRAAGNPFDNRVNVFTGTVRER